MKTYSRLIAIGVCMLVGFGFITSEAHAFIINESDESGDGKPDQWIEDLGDGKLKITRDRNSDGRVDYTLIIDANGYKVYEEQDFNHDGEMDDFYYYRAGVLTHRAVDTNFDFQVDLWVYLDEGVYIWKIERDTNFDGKIDYVKEYGPPPAEK